MPATAHDRTLTELDHLRLVNLLQRQRRGGPVATETPPIVRLLDDCDVVASRQISPDLVTMNSQILLRDVGADERYKLTLCYPQDAEPASGFVSVLSPVGSSLLGMRVGSIASWTTPTGEAKQAEILAILFQPEDSGDFVA